MAREIESESELTALLGFRKFPQPRECPIIQAWDTLIGPTRKNSRTRSIRAPRS